MSRFNSVADTKTDNLAGGQGFQESPKLKLISLVLTSFVKNQFYKNADTSIEELKELISKEDKLFVAKLALYARKEFGLRSISHVMAGELARHVKGQEWTKKFFDGIIYRPDDMTEILAYYYAKVAKTEPNALKKGFSLAFQRFGEYQLAKYRMEGKEVSLVDVANVVHPRHSEAIAKLIKGKLKNTETWEAQLSSGKDKAQTWSDLLNENKLGYFALLRNLRNILEQAPNLTDKIVEKLTNEQAIHKSLVLPFRFLSAIDAIQEASLPTQETRKVLVALNQAIDVSLSNVPRLDGDTLVIVDVSGSMQGEPIKRASVFASVLYKANSADLMLFDYDARYVNANPIDSTLSIAQSIINNATGGGTNFNAPFSVANKSYQRIIVLSDMQGWIGYDSPVRAFNEYKSRTQSNPKIYSFDLQGYGQLEFPEKNIYCLAGFSEKIFDIMKLLETDKKALIGMIEAIRL